MTTRTREQFVDVATALFAERGFYGVSLANVAAELSVTKQAVIHRFASKEKLYGEVLERITERTEQRLADALASSTKPEDQFVAFLCALPDPERDEADSRLLMRELLDNKRRAVKAGTWYLKPFLESLVGLVQRLPGWKTASKAEALALVYQLLGARNYYAISTATLYSMFGRRLGDELDRCFARQLEVTARAALDQSP